jgi:hypothetical protein
VVAGIMFGCLEFLLVSVGDIVGGFVAVALADHPLGDVRPVREEDVPEEPAVLVAVGLGRVAFEPDSLAEDELGHPFRGLASEALDGLAAINDPRGCQLNRHRSVPEQQKMLASELRGHVQYYGITGNGSALSRFFQKVVGVWCKWLNRRSQRARLNWERFNRLLACYPLPSPVVVHSVYRRAANP